MRISLTLILLLALVGPCTAQTRSQRPRSTPAAAERAAQEQFQADRKAIAELQQREIAAAMGLNIDELMATWADDGVLLPPDHAPVAGRDALRAWYDEQRKRLANYDILGYEENWNEVQISGDLGYQWGTITGRAQPPVHGEVDITLHALRVLKRQPDGSWLIERAIWNEAPAETEKKSK